MKWVLSHVFATASNRAEKPAWVSASAVTRTEGGRRPLRESVRTPLPRWYEPAAVQDTTWPVAWTPASVREEAASFSDAGGSTRRRESAASSAPCTDSTPAFCRWKPAKPVPSYESVARYVARSAARTTASGAPDGSAAQQCARRRGRHSGGRRHRQHARMRRRQRSAVLTDT